MNLEKESSSTCVGLVQSSKPRQVEAVELTDCVKQTYMR